MSSGKRKAGPQGGAGKKRRTYTGSAASAAYRRDQARMLVAVPRRALGEKKGLDTDLAVALGSVTSTTNTNGTSFVLNLVQAGTGSWNRVGRKIHSKSLRIQGVCQAEIAPTATTADLVGNVMRMVVVWDKQPSGGAIPAFDAIFGTTVQDGTEACTSIFNPPRYDNMDRFRVLRDRMYTLNPQAQTTAGTTNDVTYNLPIDEYIKLGALETVYSGQSSPMTIADISSGALYVYFRGLVNTTAVSRCAVIANGRLRYVD